MAKTTKTKKAEESAAAQAEAAPETKTEDQAATPQSETAPENEAENQAVAGEKTESGEDGAAGPAADDQGEGGADDDTGDTPPATAAPEADKLYSLEALAAENRVASWQAAALHRMMRWEKGKKVSKQEYAAALEMLKKRPLGR